MPIHLRIIILHIFKWINILGSGIIAHFLLKSEVDLVNFSDNSDDIPE